ncbi:MAG: hypothetical protein EOM87_02795 [Clostridia bacterium]|nr:hypothetical protein [Clostridia bacterium]
MYKRIKDFFSRNATAWQFAKYTIFSVAAGIIEVVLFMILNYFLPKNGINQPVSWFIFVYPSLAGGLGALIAFVVSSVVGQALKFITNFKKTFKSTNNIMLSAIGFGVMAIIIVVGLNLYVGGILNTALCKVIPNADIAGAIAKISCQITGFLLAFPVNKFILMRNKTDNADTVKD